MLLSQAKGFWREEGGGLCFVSWVFVRPRLSGVKSGEAARRRGLAGRVLSLMHSRLVYDLGYDGTLLKRHDAEEEPGLVCVDRV